MSKRKAKKYNKSKSNDNAIINNIDKLEVKTEIDYDKLAEAIVKAKKNADDEEYKSIRHLFALQKNGTSILYLTLGILGYIFAGLFIIALVATAFIVEWSSIIKILSNLFTFFIVIVGIIWIICISVFLHKSSTEIEKIKDKQLLIALSSSVTSFIALIVAIIAIFVK